MPTLILATRNRGKVQELGALLADLGVEVRSLADFPDVPEVVEDGDTFEANALKKATAVAAATGLPTLADDSGLEVDALGGEPGVYSARYGGPDLDDAGRCRILLGRLAAAGVERSPARFRCALVLALANGQTVVCHGVWEGSVAGPPRGDQGFGYDPLFEVPGTGKTVAELPAAQKNRISHRGQALAALRELLREQPHLLR